MWTRRAAVTVQVAGTIVLAVVVGQVATSQEPAGGPRAIAVTFDDLPAVSVLGNDFARAERITHDLLAALRRHDVPAIGFVNENKLQQDGEVEPRRVALLQQWLEAGLELGNHSYSHLDLHERPLDAVERDVLDGERVLRRLLKASGRAPTFFRHPFLHTGRTLDIKQSFEAFLSEHGYRVAPVTIDNSDYVFAAAYDRSSLAGRDGIASAYLDYMDAVIAYYEAQSVAILGRRLPQTLLLHANALNADVFDRLAARIEARDYTFATLERALADPAYAHADTYVGPSGITWLHRWALTEGRRGHILDGEPVVPAWIEQAAMPADAASSGPSAIP
jgi:peptidoglycan/xylan/chitin deacetylase (PgdA/CDA1 family)